MIKVKVDSKKAENITEVECEIHGTPEQTIQEFLAIAKAVYNAVSEHSFIGKIVFLKIMKNFDKIIDKIEEEDVKEKAEIDILSKIFTEVFNDESKHKQD